MDETPAEIDATHIRRLEQIHQELIDDQTMWERRKASHYLGADMILAVLDADLKINTELLKLANGQLVRLTARSV